MHIAGCIYLRIWTRLPVFRHVFCSKEHNGRGTLRRGWFAIAADETMSFLMEQRRRQIPRYYLIPTPEGRIYRAFFPKLKPQLLFDFPKSSLIFFSVFIATCQQYLFYSKFDNSPENRNVFAINAIILELQGSTLIHLYADKFFYSINTMILLVNPVSTNVTLLTRLL